MQSAVASSFTASCLTCCLEARPNLLLNLLCALPCWCCCLERGAAMTRRPQRSSSRCTRSPRLTHLLKPCSARRDPPAIQQRKACAFSHLTPRATGLPQSMRARRADRRCLAVWRPARCPACCVGRTRPAMGRVEPAAISPLFPYGVAQHTSTPFIVPDGELAITDQRAG